MEKRRTFEADDSLGCPLIAALPLGGPLARVVDLVPLAADHVGKVLIELSEVAEWVLRITL